MSSVRERTLVVDFSVLPQRPKLELVQRFVEKDLGLDPTDFRSVQLHNIRHCVLIEMADPPAAIETARLHHLLHAITINETTKITIPIYVDDNTVDVRVHDLPLDIPNTQIAEAMQQYGEVLTIRDEVWRNFFAGVPNGVRVMKMKLSKPVPSYISLCDHTTLATHDGQLITCRRCGSKRHPAKSCSEAAKLQKLPKNNNPPAPVLPIAAPAVVESQVIAPHTKDNDDEGFTIVGGKGKTKRQLSKDEDTDTDTLSTIFDDDDHCNNKGQPMEKQIKNKPKRRLPICLQKT